MTESLLITGGAGFIGSALVGEAVARGYRVLVLDKLTYAGHRANLSHIANGWELMVGDVADAAIVQRVFAQHRIVGVVHAAAESHVDNSISGSSPFMRTNILGTHVLLEAARGAWGPDSTNRFLQVSTDEVYGALGETGMFTLETPLAPNSPYAASKASADMLVRVWRHTYGLNTVITRCCNNYGPRQHPEKLVPRMLTNALAGEPLPVYGRGLQRREWIHVEDHARGVMDAFERGHAGGMYHLGSGVEFANIALVETLCDLLAEQQAGRDYRALITFVQDRLGHDFRYCLDLSSAHEIGFAPQILFEDGMRATVQWYLANDAWVKTMQEWKGA